MPYPQVGAHPQVGSHIRHESSRIVTRRQSAWIQTPAGEQNRELCMCVLCGMFVWYLIKWYLSNYESCFLRK